MSATAPAQRWRENAGLFEAELREGRRWQEWAAAELATHLCPLRVEIPDYEFREHIRDADRFTANDCDLTIRGTAVGDVVLEVKSRPVYFADTLGYPYPTAIIDTVDGWEAKRIEPRAVLLVSRTARRILVVPTATKPRWQVATRRDGVRGTLDRVYEIDRLLLQSFAWLVNKLRP